LPLGPSCRFPCVSQMSFILLPVPVIIFCPPSIGAVPWKWHGFLQVQPARNVPVFACWSLAGIPAAISTASSSRAWLRASLSVLLPPPNSSCHRRCLSYPTGECTGRFYTDMLFGWINIATVGQVVYGNSKFLQIPWRAGPFSSAEHGMFPPDGSPCSDSWALQYPFRT
jgi:hypothetical protein